MMTVINGKVSSSITHMYSVLPLKVGRFQLGPFTFTYKGDRYVSNIVFLEVSEDRRGRTKIDRPAVQEDGKAEDLTEHPDLKNRIFLTLASQKTKAYVNELIPITVKLFVHQLNASNIQLPTFDQEGFSKVEFKEPKQYMTRINGLPYDVLEFKTNIFGTKPGQYEFGPAKIKCNLIVKKTVEKKKAPIDEFFGDEDADDFFDDSFFEALQTRYERYPTEIKSDAIPLAILPLPAEGRPQDFSGAVGDYQFIYNASPKNVKVGDPITLTMAINGTGNFNTVLIPKLDDVTGFKVYDAQIKTEANRKLFTQVIIPETDQAAEVPKATFAYFDINKGEYRSITQGPIPITVEKGKEEEAAQVIGPVSAPVPGKEEEFKADIVYIKENLGSLTPKGRRLYRNKPLIASLVGLFIFVAALFIVRKRKEALRSDTVFARRTRALKAARKAFGKMNHQLKGGDARIFYETMFKALQEYLGDRLGLPPAGITTDVVDGILGPKEVELEILRKTRNLFEMCDRARFALLKPDELKMKDDLKELREIVAYFERLRI
jgi:hypothetical protein